MRGTIITLAASLVSVGLTIGNGVAAAELGGDVSLPSPQVARDLFGIGASGKNDCASGTAVVDQLDLDETQTGGTVVALGGDVGQSFADMWRRHVHEPAVPVSLIVGHLFANPLNAELLVDTVEFDAHGCAMSRTLLPAQEWSAILHDAAGEEA